MGNATECKISWIIQIDRKKNSELPLAVLSNEKTGQRIIANVLKP